MQKQLLHFLMCAAVAAFVSLAVSTWYHPQQKEFTKRNTQQFDTTFQRVMSNKKIRCGYVVYPPTVIKDLNTGKMSGSIVDIVESAAQKLGFTVEWTEELGWGNFLEGLKTGRYDMACAAGFGLPPEAKNAELIGPLYYSGIGVWVHPDNRKFDLDTNKINSPEVKISGLDGSVSNDIQKEQFPRAQILSLPTMTDYSILLLNVATRKADVALVENYQGQAFLEKNPAAIRNIAQTKPVAVFPNVLAVDKGEFKLQSMFQTVINQMHNSGEIERIVKKHDAYGNSFYFVAKPYIIP